MERVPVAESGGSAGGGARSRRGQEGMEGCGGDAAGLGGGTFTIVAGEDQGDVPAALQEGGGVQQLPLGADGAGVGVQLQPVRRVVEQRVAVGAGMEHTITPHTPPKHPLWAANVGARTRRVVGGDAKGPGATARGLGLT